MPRSEPMLVLGVTGGIGSGKSTVARLFGKLGARVLDADELAHEVMKPGKLAARKIVDAFGEDILNPDDSIHRKKLADRVFNDPEALADLEAIVHPRVIRVIREKMKRLRRNRRVHVVILDVPLLFESGSEKLADHVVVVNTPPELARARLRGRGMSEEEITRRSAAQMDPSAKVALADFVIDNSGGLDKTRRQVSELWLQLVNTRRRQRA